MPERDDPACLKDLAGLLNDSTATAIAPLHPQSATIGS